MEKEPQKGQALLIVVLIMVVVLTVGLSVASRSISNLRITNDDENSQRAFSAAEAGVERAIKSECTAATCLIEDGDFAENNTEYTTTVTPILGTEFIVRGGVQIRQDEGADILLSDYSADPTQLFINNPWSGTLTVYWGDGSGECNNAAVEILVLHGTKDDPQMNRSVYDPCNSSPARRDANGFAVPGAGGTVNSKSFQYSAPVTLAQASPGLLMRVVPLYANTIVGIKCSGSGCLAFPVQGKQIDSIGEAGGTVRRISFVQSYASVPSEFFQYILMSQ